MIPHSRPSISPDDLCAVEEIVRGQMLAQGTEAARLEAELSARFGFGHFASAVGSGSAALQLALLALNVQPGDEVVLPTYICRAVLQAVHALRARPVLCDSGPDWVVTPREVASKITARTRAVLVAHLYGIWADVPAIKALGVPVIEDACQALAARGTRAVAGDIAIVSFHPTKLITGGEGGAAVTSSPVCATRLKELRDGRYDPLARAVFSPFSDLSAALALRQLRQLDSWLIRRREIAERYRQTLMQISGTDIFWGPMASGVFYRFVLRLAGGCDRYAALFAQEGVTIRRGVDELMHRLLRQDDSTFPNAIRQYDTTVSIPLYPGLSEEELSRVNQAMAAVFGRAGIRFLA
ncbi:MAG TPA: DegT/DnrJ/EryC1/StrS family aminotransferase [Phycisphaerae bacterium]|nr:DegT/DnrJ/EryC1/StrS family aminotransferase [Phycisphaerae bacterium]